MLRVGILTSGGDCPGLNMFLATCTGLLTDVPARPVLIRDGFLGLLAAAEGDDPTVGNGRLDWTRLARLGGSVIGSSRLNLSKSDRGKQAVKGVRKLGLDALVVVGGDGSLKSARFLADHLPVVAVPKTIDNDVAGSDLALGFQSAVQTATNLVDSVVDTSLSHRTGLVVELMGRRSGFLPSSAATATNTPVVVPESEWTVAGVAERLHGGGVVLVAEGAWCDDLGPRPEKDGRPQVGGVGAVLVSMLDAAYKSPPGGFRVVCPGHVLRGGPATAADRILAHEFARLAARAAVEGRSGFCRTVSGQARIDDHGDVPSGRRFLTVPDLAALGSLLVR